jgi:hypothetical protein
MFLAAAGLLVAILALFLLLGRLTPGSGADLVDWDPVAHARRRAELDREDFEEMLELTNRDRQERGLPNVDQSEVRRRMQDAADGPPRDDPSGR